MYCGRTSYPIMVKTSTHSVQQLFRVRRFGDTLRQGAPCREGGGYFDEQSMSYVCAKCGHTLTKFEAMSMLSSEEEEKGV